jgi:hypothetical protein
MHAVYWIYKNGHQRGPFTFAQIQRMQQAATIDTTDQIRRADEQEWRSIGEIIHQIRLHKGFRSNIVAGSLLTFIGAAFVWLLAIICWVYS